MRLNDRSGERTKKIRENCDPFKSVTGKTLVFPSRSWVQSRGAPRAVGANELTRKFPTRHPRKNTRVGKTLAKILPSNSEDTQWKLIFPTETPIPFSPPPMGMSKALKVSLLPRLLVDA